MIQIALFGGLVVVGLSLIADSPGTIKTLIVIITIRGVTWLVKKIVSSMNQDYADMINFTGYALMTGAGVKLLKMAIDGVKPLTDNLKTVFDPELFKGFADFIDSITFWN